jgi:heme exporter protein D
MAMANWLSYSISDFLPFSLETFNRLFVLYNARFSPAFAVGLGLGVVALALLVRTGVWRVRVVLAGFGLAWLWISWAFHLQTLQPLLWAAGPFALAFALQSGLLLASAVLPWEGRHSELPFGGSKAGYVVLAVAVLLLPLAGLMTERLLSGLELFGTAPDPTAIATLGLASMLPARLAWLLFPIPLTWCLVSSAMLWGLDSPVWPIPATLALITLVGVLWRHE